MNEEVGCVERIRLDYESAPRPARGALTALTLLLLINMFNYIDRYVLAAVEPEIRNHFFPGDGENARTKSGLLASAFLISYMLISPIFGRLADRFPRWPLVGISVILWSLASGASGLAMTFTALLVTRAFVGIGEAGYGPSAPTIISDLYPVKKRGAVLAWFYMAISVGSALGYVLGGFVGVHMGWRWAFLVVVPPGIALGIWALLMRDPPRGQADAIEGEARPAQLRDYLVLLKTPSYVLDTAGMIALTFAIGGISFWMKDFLGWRQLSAESISTFGIITAVAGLTATLAGGLAGDWLRGKVPGAYFVVSSIGIWISCPLVLMVARVPFPAAWAIMFFAMFFLFFNTGPSNAILANVTHPSVRATAFAFNIFVIHLLGDVISPPLLGWIIGKQQRYDLAFLTVALVMALAGALWLWGAKYLDRDTALAPKRLAPAESH